MLNELHLAFQCRIEMVFYMIISSTREKLGDLRPPIPVLHVRFDDQVVFLFRPLVLLNIRIQMVVPSTKIRSAD